MTPTPSKSDSHSPAKSKNGLAKFGLGLSILVMMPFVMSASMKFRASPEAIQGLSHFGWPEGSILTLGILEALSVIVYLIPQTSALGAILLTGYLGGAIATHLRLQEPVYLQVLFGVLIWAGLYLRDSRVRSLIPIRRPE